MDKEARLRGLNDYLNLSMAEIKINLHELLLVEKRYHLILSILDCSNLDEAMIRLEQALPCLLHLENRPSETIIEWVLRFGLALCEGSNQEITAFIAEIESIINENIFGSVGCASNWKFPINDDGTMGKVKLANWHARKILQEIGAIVNCSIPGEDRHEEHSKWMLAITAFQRAIQVSVNLYVSFIIIFTMILI